MTPREFVLAFAPGSNVPGHHTLHEVVAAVAANTVDVPVHAENSGSRTVQFAMLCSFVGTFTLTRLVVRMIRSGVGPFFRS